MEYPESVSDQAVRPADMRQTPQDPTELCTALTCIRRECRHLGQLDGCELVRVLGTRMQERRIR